MLPMEFIVQQCQIASLYVPPKSDGRRLTSEEAEAKIFAIIKISPSSSDEISAAIGLSRSSVNHYMHELFLHGEIELHAKPIANIRSTVYRVRT